jgi:hypothetical protein
VAFGDIFTRRKKQQVIARIVAALRFRVLSLVKAPIVTEREFIALTANHGQFAEKLRQLGQPVAAVDMRRNALHVGMCWLRLGKEHLDDAEFALSGNRARSVFSRSYYAAYNASKAVRYIVVGWVSLKSDDHSKASDLPDDFPNAEKWAEMIPKLLEHREFSDYDNWNSTASQHTLSPREAFELAKEFLQTAQSYTC